SEADVPPEELPFWDVEQDLQSLGEFMQTWLSKQQRWLSPIFIAGESYGGFRVARLTNLLQRQFGIGLCGAILISPVLEFSLVRGNDYDLMHWATLIPTFAAAAAYHGKARYTATAEAQLDSPLTVEQNRLAAEQFCQRTLLPVLAGGCAIPTAERQAVYQQLADLIGLPPALVEQHQGRISPSRFARELLRQEQKIVGLYDAALTAIDPFPDRPLYEGSEPTLDSSQHLFTAAINQHLCSTLGVETDLTYRLLDFDVNRNWQFQSQAQKSTWRQGYVGAVDELRVGMTLNPALKIYLCHGYFDLVTTYAASSYLVNLMQLAPEIRDNLTVQNFNGGHMFYSWDQSRLEWFQAMQRFYERAIAADG
ncbi:MAG: peptidase S10, partial [Cyanobacteria bacterium P01_H01_bin.121]